MKKNNQSRVAAIVRKLFGDRFSNKRPFVLVGLVLTVAGTGTYLTFSSHAATPVISIEAENGTLSGSSVVGTDTNASNGKYVKFNAASTSPDFRTCYPYAFCNSSNQQIKINGANIRNVGSYSSGALCGDWGGFATRGFNVVRLAVDWPAVETAQGTFTFTKLDDVVSKAEASGLYVILDGIHTTTSSSNNWNLPTWTTGTDTMDKVSMGGPAYWTALAAHYKNDPKVIAYDLMNEPQPPAGGLNQNKAFTMYNSLIDSVRAVDSDKIVIMEPITGGSSLAGVNWDLITNKSNLVFSFHDYFAGDDDDGFGTSGYMTGSFVYDGTSGYTDNTTNRAEMANFITTVQNWLTPQRLPLYIGEYGIGNTATGATAWLTQKDSIYDANNLPRTYWEGCSQGTMALYNNSSKTWLGYNYPSLFGW